MFPQPLPVTLQKYTATFFLYRKALYSGRAPYPQLFSALAAKKVTLYFKPEDLEDSQLTNICTHWKAKEFQLIYYKKIISCVLPMVVITVPAKKKELPKSQ